MGRARHVLLATSSTRILSLVGCGKAGGVEEGEGVGDSLMVGGGINDIACLVIACLRREEGGGVVVS